MRMLDIRGGMAAQDHDVRLNMHHEVNELAVIEEAAGTIDVVVVFHRISNIRGS